MFDARDLPCISTHPKVDEWLVNNEVSTHCANDVIQLYEEEGHDNAFVEWFETKYDYKFDRSKVNYVAILGT